MNRRVPARSPAGRPFGPSAVRRLTAVAAVDYGPWMGWRWRAALMSLSPRDRGDSAEWEACSGGAFPKRAVRRLDDQRRLPERTVGCG
jgi:hypothetical protein